MGEDVVEDAAVEQPAGEAHAGCTVGLGDGTLVLGSQEFKLLSQLFTVLDADGDRAVAGSEGAVFLRRANLDDQVLREVWRLACGGRSKAKLSREEWFAACRLVAIAQSGPTAVALSRASLFDRTRRVPAPDFGLFEREPDFVATATPPFPAAACQVRVGNPAAVGTGLARHVQYSIALHSSLPHFLRGSATVSRRYSDFRWLDKRLRARFPGTAVPPVPAKRMFGNLSARFVEERRLALEQYIASVARHAKLSLAFEVQAFLYCSPEGFHVFRTMLETSQGLGALALPGAGSGDEEDSLDAVSQSGTEPSGLYLSRPGAAGVAAPVAGASAAAAAATSWVSRIIKRVEDTVLAGASDERASGGLADSHLLRQLKRLGVSQERVVEVRMDLAAYTKRLEAAIAVIERFLASRRAHGYELARVAAYMGTMSQLEANRSDFDAESPAGAALLPSAAMQPPHLPPHAQGSGDLFDQVSVDFDRLSNHLQDLNDRCSAEMLAPLRFQLGQVASLQGLLANFDHCVLALKAAHDGLALAKKRYASARAQNGLAEPAQSGIQLAEDEIAAAEQTVVLMFGSVELETATFHRERQRRTRLILESFVQTEAQGALRARHNLAGLAHRCSDGADPSLLSASTSRLSANHLDPVDNLPRWFSRKAKIAADSATSFEFDPTSRRSAQPAASQR